MGGCQNYGPFLGILNIRCRIIIGVQKRTIILTTTHVGSVVPALVPVVSEEPRGLRALLESERIRKNVMIK